MAQQTPSFAQYPTWTTINAQVADEFGNITTQPVSILPQNQTNQYLQSIKSDIAAVNGSGGGSANINGPLSMNGNPISGVTNSSPPAPDEALSAAAASALYNTFRQALKTVTADYAILATDGTILVDATAGNITLTLPDATTVGAYIYPIMQVDSSGNTVSLATVKSQSVSGPATSVSAQWARMWPQSDGRNWWVILN